MKPGPPFRDPDLPLEVRLDDLLGRLTRDEKVALLHQHQPAVPRLGLEAFHTGREALHGVAWLGPATVFPQAVGLASTWDPELVRRVGSAVGDEVRGFQHRDPETGLNVWAPVVNLLRDPRWGRNEEGYAEDPLLTGEISTAYAAGLRGDHPVYLKTAPTLKHFLAYNCEDERDTVSVSVRPRVLREYELEAFRPALEAGVATGVMPSYNLVNGRPAHLSPLLEEAVRAWSEQELLVVSDAFAPSNIAGSQGYYADHAQAHAAAIRAGLDSFTDQGTDPSLTVASVRDALERGLLTEAEVERAVRRSLSIRFRLGELDPPSRNPHAAITDAVIGTPEHRELAREVARKAMVLLKNDGATLPLAAEGVGRVAVVGPLAATLYEDWYSGTLPYQVTPVLGIAARLGDGGSVVCEEGVDRVALRVGTSGAWVSAPERGGALRVGGSAEPFDVFDWGEGVSTLRAGGNGRYVTLDEGDVLANTSVQPRAWVVKELFRLLPQGDGSVLVQNASSGRYVAVSGDGRLAATAEGPGGATRFVPQVLVRGLETAAAAAREADVAIVVVGNAPCVNGRETQDRRDIALPPAQERLLREVAGANPRTVLVVESSYPMAVTWAQEHVPAILWSSHGGQEMGNALADVLFGDHAPAGRLTQTWYRSVEDLGDIRDYDIIGSRQTYLYFEGTPLYPFGHGLTCTTFRYADLRLSSPSLDVPGTVTVGVDVTNTGSTASDEVVQLYTRTTSSRVRQPVRRLRGFRRVHVLPGQTVGVAFALRATDLAIWDVTRGRFAVERGTYEILVGRSSADIQLTAPLEVHGEDIPTRRVRGVETRAADFDDWSGARLVDETRTRGDAVAPVAGRGWIAFTRVDLGPGVTSFTARVSRAEPGEAAIELRLDDSETGPLIGTATVPSTGDRYVWTATGTSLSNATGTRDLFLVLIDDLNLATFSLT